MQLSTTSPEIRLASWSQEHRDQLVTQANDHDVWRNLFDTFPHPYTAEDADFWVRHTSEAHPSCHFAILVRGSVAGGIGIEVGAGTEAKTGQFGYWLGRTYWGQGIATVAAQAMVAHARKVMPLARLQAPVFAWNPASMRVLEKSDFQREAVLRQSVFKDGQLIDSILYALILGDA